MAAAQLQDKYVLRLPDGMRDRLKVAAADNGRSMNAEIVARLEASLASPSVADQLAAVEATVRTLAAKIEGMPPVTPPRARRAQVGGRDLATLMLATGLVRRYVPGQAPWC